MAAPASAPAVSQRVLGIDLWRAFAAVSIIWVHAGRSVLYNKSGLMSLGVWGTSFLNLLAGYFVVVSLHKLVCSGSEPAPAWKLARHRVWRIGGAFVLWSLIYVAARFVNYAIFGKISTLTAQWSLLIHGTEYHLWFLPYLVVVTLATLPLVSFGIRTPSRSLWIGVFLVSAALVIIGIVDSPMNPLDDGMSGFMTKILVRSPCFFIGLALGMWSLHGRFAAPGWSVVSICIAVMLCAIVLLVVTDLPRPILSRMAAVAAFIASQAPWRGPIARWIAGFGVLGFGVYLSHVLFNEAILTTLRAFHVPTSIYLDIAVWAAVTVISFAAVAWMRRTPALRWLIP